MSVDGRPATGVLAFRDGNTQIGSALLINGKATILVSNLAIGLHSITAVYEGASGDRPAASAALQITISGSVQIKLEASDSSPAPNQSLTLTATVASTAGGTPFPSGMVIFFDGSARLGSGALNAFAQATLTLLAGLSAGDHAIRAAYDGDPNFLPGSVTFSLRVRWRATSTTLSERIEAGGPSLTAMVTSSSGVPSGVVEFKDLTAARSLGEVPLDNGSASLLLTDSVPPGDRIQATYGGDSGSAPSDSMPIPFLVAVNPFSFAYSGFGADEISVLFGAGLTSETQTAGSSTLPTLLAGITVRLAASDGVSYEAPLYYVSPVQINFVIPTEFPPGPAHLSITGPEGAVTVRIASTRSAPALATADKTGAGTASGLFRIVHADGTQDPLVKISDSPILFGSATDELQLFFFGTGFRHALERPTCSLAEDIVSVEDSGAQQVYPGLDQINLRVPDTLRGAGWIAVRCTVDGQVSNAVNVNLQ